MIQEMGDDKVAKCIVWVKARPDYEPLFSILHSLRLNGERCDGREHIKTEEDIF